MIFQIGFNACATTALYALFSCSGARAIHSSGQYWRLRQHPAVKGRNIQAVIRDNIAAGRKPLETLDGFDAFFDMTCTAAAERVENFRAFRTLAEAYPQAKFLLNWRDLDAWLWRRARHKGGASLRREMDQGGLSEADVLAAWAEDHAQHHAAVRAYFAKQPGRLLDFNVDHTPVAALVAFAAPTFALNPALWQPEAGRLTSERFAAE